MSTRRLVWALLALEVLATILDLWLGPWSRMHWEERFNARAGVQLTCGHWERIWDLQYRSFCGGCTAEAVLAVPVFRALGATVLAWKIIPVSFHLAVTALGTAVAQLAAGPRAAVIWLGLMIGAPGFYRDLALTGWGNHVESSVFPLGAVLLMAFAAGARVRGRATGLLVAGLWTGLGWWFCHTSAHALVALGVGAVLVSRRWWPLFWAGIPIGAAPWWISQGQIIDQRRGIEWLQQVQPAPFSRLLDWFTGPMLRNGLWSPADHGDLGVLPETWWAALWALALGGGVWLLRAAWRGEVTDRGAAVLGPLAVVGLVGAYALRFDLWHQLPDSATDPSLNLRYLSPLIPMLWLAAAGAPRALAAHPRARRGVELLLLLMVVGGVGARVGQWMGDNTSELAESVYAHSGWPDRTVPVGQPPQQLARKWYRSSDLQAAKDFVDGHGDPLLECRWDHWQELGRRLGLAIAHAEEGVPPQARWLGELPADVPRDLVADAVVKPWFDRDANPADLAAQAASLDSVAPGWGLLLREAAARRVDLHQGGQE